MQASAARRRWHARSSACGRPSTSRSSAPKSSRRSSALPRIASASRASSPTRSPSGSRPTRRTRCRTRATQPAPASTPSFDLFDELRAAVSAARARETRSDALSALEALELATLGSARALGLEREVGSLAPCKRADLAVVSLEGSPYFPWEDPTVAVVFGGSPDRVVATFVDGETRYEKGGVEWHELRSAATSARSRMLGGATTPVAE